MKTVKRVASWAGIGIGALLALGALLLLDRFGAARLSVAETRGQLRVPVTLPVDIIRDQNSVAHIYGQSEEDVSFALGLVHAQERLWQMELFRRIGQGRLAEIFGAPAVPVDLTMRTLRLYRDASASFDHLEPETRRLLEAYARGVNTYLAQSDQPLPPEFQFLFHTPEPWQPADSLVMIKILALGLSGNAFSEISRARLHEVLSPEQIEQIFPPYPGDAPVAIRNLAALYEDTELNTAFLFPEQITFEGASNNWVVDGSLTETGSPLLANDPHLGMLAPSVWYLAHLSYGDRNVVGGTIAGVPSVVLGRNDHIAWGYTTTRTDVQDLYIEKVNPDNPNEYLTPDGWASFSEREETITVRFGSDERVTFRETRHGPVLPADFPGMDELAPDGHVLAFAWTALDGPDLTLEAGHKITRATNFADFLAALRSYTAPMQSMVFANTEGEIGFIAPGRVPIRSTENATNGKTPVPGWEAANDWLGEVPFEDLPQVLNPESGYVLTANNKIVDDNYPYHLTDGWDLPYRAERIEQLLRASDSHSLESFLSMQMDNHSPIAEQFVPLLLARLDGARRAGPAATLLADWSFKMEGEQAAPLIFINWLRHLTREIYEDELGEQFSGHWRLQPIFLEQVLNDRHDQSAWCHKADEETSCDDIIQRSWDAALRDLEEQFGSDMAAWSWREAHQVTNRHIPGSFLPIIGDRLTISRPSDGGIDTINRGQHSFSASDPFANVHAAGFRAVYDFSDLERSRYMTSTGQSGNPFSPDYDHLVSTWAEGQFIEIPTDRTAFTPSAIMQLRPTE